MSILEERYASKEIVNCFSQEHRMRVWRELWIALAKAERSCGLPITDSQISELISNKDTIHLQRIKEIEVDLHHDVMAAIHAYAELCPNAKPIIHLGATSCFVTDNADILLMRSALTIIGTRLLKVISTLRDMCLEYKDVACLGYTHLQPAQPTTVGKRAALWLQDFVMDLEYLARVNKSIRLRGIKGTTGTQASFLRLFNGDHGKLKALESAFSTALNDAGFDTINSMPLTSQVYSRKIDAWLLHGLAQIGTTSAKIGNDIRLLSSFGEIQEPFGEKQVGSSAMPYKRNPILSERICSLGRGLIDTSTSLLHTHATQWLERSLDDSAYRRIVIPDAFFLSDSILSCMDRLLHGLVVNTDMIKYRLHQYYPFMASENILMTAVKNGSDRQKLHEKIRIHSMDVYSKIRAGSNENDLLKRLKNDPDFILTDSDWDDATNENAIAGASAMQVDSFISEYVDPLIKQPFSKMPVGEGVFLG